MGPEALRPYHDVVARVRLHEVVPRHELVDWDGVRGDVRCVEQAAQRDEVVARVAQVPEPPSSCVFYSESDDES